MPEELKQAQRDVHLCFDIMYIQIQMVLVTVSKNIKYISIDPIKERSRKLVSVTLDKVFKTYNQSEFRIHTVYAYPEFVFMQDPLANLDIDMVIDDARDSVDEPNINVVLHKSTSQK